MVAAEPHALHIEYIITLLQSLYAYAFNHASQSLRTSSSPPSLPPRGHTIDADTVAHQLVLTEVHEHEHVLLPLIRGPMLLLCPSKLAYYSPYSNPIRPANHQHLSNIVTPYS